ncbi:MAG: hypothetical protein WDO24_26310 [Pseudomonadota bacterium]
MVKATAPALLSPAPEKLVVPVPADWVSALVATSPDAGHVVGIQDRDHRQGGAAAADALQADIAGVAGIQGQCLSGVRD